jgi:hypothetical protein
MALHSLETLSVECTEMKPSLDTNIIRSNHFHPFAELFPVPTVFNPLPALLGLCHINSNICIVVSGATDTVRRGIVDLNPATVVRMLQRRYV